MSAPRTARSEPLQVTLFHDLLCAYCLVTAERLRALKGEFGDTIQLALRPFPLRTEPEAMLEERERKRAIRTIRAASKEPEGAELSTALWSRSEHPTSSILPLIAAEAAKLQGVEAQARFVEKVRSAALRSGLNVARRDILLELASASGLDAEQFATALELSTTRRAVERSFRDAYTRGVRALPAVAIGDEWLLTGLKSAEEYREAILRYLRRRSAEGAARVLH